ncbi:uncharacterized protein A1O9_01584 [Exophiala aquamarina CBS 119918]|uniref:Zn(2)-C6 fungal-type domain-containing protein n=1 Tax=Exophiala aquamarina CBS 119918 TaxID=1182545 RepID=A0A072PUR8_9EURO|nr:uncharacterized protein A1O9_01584 [Exophiala aquamarina CBS 119918]KEF63606.1 hypothetical protein A1O9_01584 [Exophiala aquamarina CBS 119918]
MVGGARSKGCLTCRRRKIRCDLQQPTCLQCHRSKRRCGGYDRYPVFVVYTKHGMEKREAMKDPMHTEFQDSWKLEIRPGCENTSLISTPESMFEDSTVKSFQSMPTERSRFVSWAYENYIKTLSARNQFNHMPVARFLRSTLTLAAEDTALDTAMLAISCRMSAVYHTDQTLLNKSRQLYTCALGLLQRNLASPKLALTDETFAATCLLALYELTSLDRNDPEAWKSHVAGISAVLQARGAKRHNGAFSRDALEHCRYNLMMQCITSRNAFGFASGQWLDDPWNGAKKQVEQQVMDEGFRLAQILQIIDDDSFWWVEIESIQELLRMCEIGSSRLYKIKAKHLPGPTSHELRKPQPPASDKDLSRGVETDSQTSNRLVLRQTASAIQLGLCEATRCIMQKVLESSYYGITHCGSSRWKITDPESCIETEVVILEDGMQLAKEVVSNTNMIFNEFSDPELPPEAIRLLFPLKMSSRMLKYCTSCPQYEQCNTFINYLSGTKGSNYAKARPKEFFVYGGSRQKNISATEAL